MTALTIRDTTAVSVRQGAVAVAREQGMGSYARSMADTIAPVGAQRVRRALDRDADLAPSPSAAGMPPPDWAVAVTSSGVGSAVDPGPKAGGGGKYNRDRHLHGEGQDQQVREGRAV